MDEGPSFQELKDSVKRHKKKIWKRMVKKNLVITSVTWDTIWREMKKSRCEVHPELVHRLQSWYLLYQEFPSHKTEEQALLSPSCEVKKESYFSPFPFDLEAMVLPGDLWYREDPIEPPDKTWSVVNDQLPSRPSSELDCKEKCLVSQKMKETPEMGPNPNTQCKFKKTQKSGKRKGVTPPAAGPWWTRVLPGVFPEDCQKDEPVARDDIDFSRRVSKHAHRVVHESKTKRNENVRNMKNGTSTGSSSRSEVKKVHWSPPSTRLREPKPRGPVFKRESQTPAQHDVSQQRDQKVDFLPKSNTRGKSTPRRIVPMAATKSRKPQSRSSNGKSRVQHQTPQMTPRTKLKSVKKREKHLLQQESKKEIVTLEKGQVSTKKEQIAANKEHIASTEATTIKKIPEFPPSDYVYQKGDWTVHAIVSSSAEKNDVKEALQKRDYKVKSIVRRKCKLPNKWICSLIASADRTHILTSENIWLKGWEVDFVCNEEEIAQFLD